LWLIKKMTVVVLWLTHRDPEATPHCIKTTLNEFTIKNLEICRSVSNFKHVFLIELFHILIIF
jgi:hypothetical protein